METFLVMEAHLIKGVYAAKTDVSNFDGDIVVAEDLGHVYFPDHVKASCGIKARPGSGIHAAGNISAGRSISAGLGITAGGYISTYADIFAGTALSAGSDVAACGNISAEWDILAGGGIYTDESVSAGFSIEAKWIDAGAHISAGTCPWKVLAPKQMEIRAEIRSGEIISGIHVPPEAK